MDDAQGRWGAVRQHHSPRMADKTRTALAVALGRQLAPEGHWPQAPEAFDTGLVPGALARGMERMGQRWGRELACSRPMQWPGQWQRIATGATLGRRAHPASFRAGQGRCRPGETQQVWVLPTVIRLKRFGRNRVVLGP